MAFANRGPHGYRALETKSAGRVHPPKLYQGRPRNQCRLMIRAAEGPEILYSMCSRYNHVNLFRLPPEFPPDPQLANCVALMLDESKSIHSIYKEDTVLLGERFYWELLALIAAVAPEGPIGILGLGAGTVARVINQYWPQRKMHGWELDDVVLDASRKHMGLQILEDSGALVAHAGDALIPEASIKGGFAGVVVDLFAGGKVVEPLRKVAIWEGIQKKLQPGGKVIANLGDDGPSIEAMQYVFTDAGLCLRSSRGNTLAITGGNPGDSCERLPHELQHLLEGWKANNST